MGEVRSARVEVDAGCRARIAFDGYDASVFCFDEIKSELRGGIGECFGDTCHVVADAFVLNGLEVYT